MTTATTSSDPDLLDELLAELLRRMDRAEHPDQVLEEFCQQHPDRAAEARRRTRFARAVDRSKPDSIQEHPKQLGDFRIIRRMARGGMGVIYEAVQERLKRRVVLKTLRAGLAEGPGRLRFLREQEALARLHQTHIVPIHTADEEAGLQYFVMPYIEGASLNHLVDEARHAETKPAASSSTSLSAMAAQWLEKSGKQQATDDDAATTPAPPPKVNPPPSSRALTPRYFRSVAHALADVAEGLHHAHQAGLLHRDVKPSNLMIEPNGKCWLIDFGLAAFSQREVAEDATTSACDTESLTLGNAVGTPAYMAPEQWDKDGHVDARTDVWGLGATLYELLTLQRPFTAASNASTATQKQQLRTRIDQSPPLPPSRLVTHLPADLAAICMKALERDPARRYQTALEMANDLRRWLCHEPTRALPGVHRRVWLWARRNTGWAAALATLAVVLIVVPIAVALHARRERFVQELLIVPFTERCSGWSKDAEAIARKGAAIGRTSELTDTYTATLSLMDASLVKQYTGNAGQLAFDPQGRQLLMGGCRGSAARLAVVGTDEVVTGKPGAGPVGYTAEGVPLQLVQDPNTPTRLELWDVRGPKRLQEYLLPVGEEFKVTALSLSADGSVVAAAYELARERGGVRIWEATGKVLRTLDHGATALALSPEGRYLAAGTAKGIMVYSVAKPDLSLLPLRGRATPRALGFGRNPPRGSHPWRLACGDEGGTITIWELDTPVPVSYCRGSRNEVLSVTFSPDGTLLASAGRAKSKLWDVATGTHLLDVSVRNTMHGVAFSPAGRHLAISSIESFGGTNETLRGAVDIWELQAGRGTKRLRGLNGTIAKCVFSPDSRLVAALSHGWQLGVWDTSSGRLLYILDVLPGFWTDSFGLAFNQDASRLALCTGRRASLHRVASGEELQSWDLPPAQQDHLAFHPSGRLLLFRLESASGKTMPVPNRLADPMVCRIRDLASPASPPLEIKDFGADVYFSCISREGDYYYVSGSPTEMAFRKGMVKVFRGTTGEVLWSSHFADDSGKDGRAEFDPTGQLLACWHLMPGATVVLKAATGESELVQKHNDVIPLFRTQKYWRDIQAHALRDGRTGQYLFSPGKDTTGSHGWVFNTAQTHFLCGNSDGTVLVVDIHHVQRSLAAVGLGW